MSVKNATRCDCCDGIYNPDDLSAGIEFTSLVKFNPVPKGYCGFCKDGSKWFCGRKCCETRLLKENRSVTYKIGVIDYTCPSIV